MPSSKIDKLSMENLGRLSPEDYQQSEKIPVCLVLDNIRSLQNVGSFFRTGDGFRIAEIILCGITGTPPNRDIEKTALGSTESVPYVYFKTNSELLTYLKKKEYAIYCLEQTKQSILLQDFQPSLEKSYAFIFGNEVFGVQQELLEESEGVLEIPQFGTKHSFNVSVSVGIVLWDYYLKTNGKRSVLPS